MCPRFWEWLEFSINRVRRGGVEKSALTFCLARRVRRKAPGREIALDSLKWAVKKHRDHERKLAGAVVSPGWLRASGKALSTLIEFVSSSSICMLRQKDKPHRWNIHLRVPNAMAQPQNFLTITVPFAVLPVRLPQADIDVPMVIQALCVWLRNCAESKPLQISI